MSVPSPVRSAIPPLFTEMGRIDQIASQRPEPREGAILVRSRETTVADDTRNKDRRDFPGSRHRGPSGYVYITTKIARTAHPSIERSQPKATPTEPERAFSRLLIKAAGAWFCRIIPFQLARVICGDIDAGRGSRERNAVFVCRRAKHPCGLGDG